MEQKSEIIFSTLRNQAAKSFVESQDSKNDAAESRLYLAVLGILVFVGAEAVKAFFRKDFAVTSKGLLRFVFCFLAFAGLSVLSFYYGTHQNNEGLGQYGTPLSHFIVGIAYSLMAVLILVRGIFQVSQTKAENRNITLNGKSLVFTFLANLGWRGSTIQNVAEPLAIMVIGAVICFFDVLGGIPLIFCGLSVWLMALLNMLLGEVTMEQTVNRLNTNAAEYEVFNEIRINSGHGKKYPDPIKLKNPFN